jgi:hypothetical protein
MVLITEIHNEIYERVLKSQYQPDPLKGREADREACGRDGDAGR